LLFTYYSVLGLVWFGNGMVIQSVKSAAPWISNVSHFDFEQLWKNWIGRIHKNWMWWWSNDSGSSILLSFCCL